MKVTLIRHAQTRSNLFSRYIGSTDEPLAPEGIVTARKAAADLTVKQVHTGTLTRAIQTARILYPNANIDSRPGLNEMDFGRFEGKHWRELQHDPDYEAWVASQCETPCPDGESRKAFTRRCQEAFSSVVREYRESGEDVYFVVHGGTIMAIMSGCVLPQRDYFAWKTGFCGGFVLESTADGKAFTLIETVVPPSLEEQREKECGQNAAPLAGNHGDSHAG